MLKRYRYWRTGRIPSLLYHLVRAYSWTFRLHVENEKPWLDYLQEGGRVLLCGWHQQFVSAIGHFKNYASYRPALMISQSKDCDIIAGIAQKSGWHTVPEEHHRLDHADRDRSHQCRRKRLRRASHKHDRW